MSGPRRGARSSGCILVGLAALFGAQAIVFVPEASACLPGYRPKPGVTNPTDNERDCEPDTRPESPPPPAGGAVAPPEPTRPKRRPPTPSPSEQRKKVEEYLGPLGPAVPLPSGRGGVTIPPPGGPGGVTVPPPGPSAPPPGPAAGPDEAIKRIGEKIKEGGAGERDEEFVCGPDITAVLKLMVAEIEMVWHNLPETVWDRDLGKSIDPRRWTCRSIAPIVWDSITSLPKVNWPAVNAWDCQELRGTLQASATLFPDCAKGKDCERTVMIDGKCFYAGSVNYVIFGVLWRECEKRATFAGGGTVGLKEVIHQAKKRRNASNFPGSYGWAEATYKGWPHTPGVASPPGESDRAHCATTCPAAYLKPLHWWIQGLQGRGTRPEGTRPRNLNGEDGKGYHDDLPNPRHFED